MRRVIIRHIVLVSLPLILGLAVRLAFAWTQKSCGDLVGPLFAAKCGRIQRDYELLLQTAGTVVGCILAATVGIWLERRRTRATTAAGAGAAAP
jgi:hypothetical protein